MNYWWSYFQAVLPGAVWMSACAVPALAGVFLAERAFRRGNRPRGIVFVVASLFAGLASVAMVGSLLWGGGSGSSTEPLVWVFAPVYSTIVLAVTVAVGRIIVRFTNRSPKAVRLSPLLKAGLLGPPLMVVLLLAIGITRYSFQNGGMRVAAGASDPEILRELYHREGAASSSSGVQLFLAQNRATPGDVLDAVSRTSFAHVRVHVAANRNTPRATLARLTADPNSKVRSAAQRQRPPTP